MRLDKAQLLQDRRRCDSRDISSRCDGATLPQCLQAFPAHILTIFDVCLGLERRCCTTSAALVSPQYGTSSSTAYQDRTHGSAHTKDTSYALYIHSQPFLGHYSLGLVLSTHHSLWVSKATALYMDRLFVAARASAGFSSCERFIWRSGSMAFHPLDSCFSRPLFLGPGLVMVPFS
ncbi:hypothetical protein BU26DRAFT_149636 [Trematosphaeria pertusa]|uniref:Uncharacterized protein n=1 Tax=Trematosphaeria pertusa TaxID=390896 RepID=A0A6A6IWT3_9PLEO|nr:uncharacterized protein BU26DRAFT_149636 [Trematosphaeria pertusa]KAF2255015.1 hypothetical protein BU26DRAFT_149636 [Trematosphaeria pertusa]